MSRVTIEVDDKIWANSLAIWFESGDALEAFYESNEYIILEEIRKEQYIPSVNEVVVEFDRDETDYSADHTIILELSYE